MRGRRWRSLYAALRYRGKAGERFSLLNHFISELGEVGVSRGAWAFNGGLALTGLLLLPFVVHLGIVLGGVLGWGGAFFAAAATGGVAAVGIFPMNNRKPARARRNDLLLRRTGDGPHLRGGSSGPARPGKWWCTGSPASSACWRCSPSVPSWSCRG